LAEPAGHTGTGNTSGSVGNRERGHHLQAMAKEPLRGMDKAIVKNIAINFIGLAVPTFVSLGTVPAYIHVLGLERFGVIALVWVLIDYFGLLGFAMSVAAQNQISKAYAAGDLHRCRELFWSTAFLNLAVGVLIGLVVFCCAWIYTQYFMDPASALRHEMQVGLFWLAFAVPVANSTCVFAAAMSGAEKFGAFNATLTAGTILFQLVPLGFALLFGATLENVLASAVIVRLLTAARMGWQSAQVLQVREVLRPQWSVVKGLFNFGGWMLVSTVITMATESVDRLFVGAAFGAQQLARYSVPKNLVIRLGIVSLALERSLFPRLSSANREHASTLTQQSLVLLNGVYTPISLVCMLAVGPFLHVWVGTDIASVAAPLAHVMIIGMWLVGQADITRILIQSQVNPATAARACVLQLALYLGLLWIAIAQFGLMGVAVVTVVRAVFDYFMLLYISRVPARSTILEMLSHLAFLLANLWVIESSLSDSVMYAAGALLVLANVSWSLAKSPALRQMGWSFLMRLSPRRGV
jgi:O-antigen/teichoic acid export membrane protein